MALARVKTWNAGDTLTAADLNAEFNNILNNPTSLINLSAAGDLAIVSSAAAVTRLAIGTAGQALNVSTGLLPAWGSAVLQGYLSGCQVTAVTAATSGQMTISSGIAVDGANTVAMVLSSALVGTTTGTFIAGNAQPKMESTLLLASQVYHTYVISSATGASVDILYSSSTSPTLPAGYSKSRRIGSFITTSTNGIRNFIQDGDYFKFSTGPPLDFNSANPGTGAVNRTLTVPTGTNVFAFGAMECDVVAAAQTLYVSEMGVTDEAATNTATPLGQMYTAASVGAEFPFLIRASTSAQIRTRLQASDANTTLRGVTYGWYDQRGRTV